MQVDFGFSDDYSVLETGYLKFYYGYEITDPKTDAWCFQVTKNGVEIFRITTKEIEKSFDLNQLNYANEYLIAGIGIWLLLK